MQRKKPTYTWGRWLKEPGVTLIRGVDYTCSQSGMVQTIRNNASLRGVRVRITDNTDSITIEVIGEVQNARSTSAVAT